MAALGLLEVIAVPVKGRAGGETGEKVAYTDAAAGAEDEEADGGGEEEVTLVVDPLPVTGVSTDARLTASRQRECGSTEGCLDDVPPQGKSNALC